MYYEVGVPHKGGGAGADLGARFCHQEGWFFFSHECHERPCFLTFTDSH
jgi:hypothetical protein